MNPARQRLKQEFLASYRKARKAMDPGLLEEARKSIIEALQRLDREKARETGRETGREKAAGTARATDGRSQDSFTVPIDRKQNLSVIMKYLEMNPDNKQVRDQLQTALREDL